MGIGRAQGLELDDSLPQAHNSMAGWYSSMPGIGSAPKLNPCARLRLTRSFAEGYHMHSYILTVTNRLAEAIEEQKRGRR